MKTSFIPLRSARVIRLVCFDRAERFGEMGYGCIYLKRMIRRGLSCAPRA